jgi:hypothetical protein
VAPILTIVAQSAFTTPCEFAGLLVATPIVADGVEPVRQLYVRAVLGDTADDRGE